MLSISKCKEILNKTKDKYISYTDEQIKSIRDLLYQFANYQFLIEENNLVKSCHI